MKTDSDGVREAYLRGMRQRVDEARAELDAALVAKARATARIEVCRGRIAEAERQLAAALDAVPQ